MTDRVKKILEIAERIHRSKSVYERLPKQELTRKRNFSALSTPPSRRQNAETSDLIRTYGF